MNRCDSCAGVVRADTESRASGLNQEGMVLVNGWSMGSGHRHETETSDFGATGM